MNLRKNLRTLTITTLNMPSDCTDYLPMNAVAGNPVDPIPYYIMRLKDELRTRSFKNCRYSLRAMARDLSIDSGALCKIMSQTQPLSAANAFKIINHLKLDGEDRDRFCRSICEEKVRELYESFGIN